MEQNGIACRLFRALAPARCTLERPRRTAAILSRLTAFAPPRAAAGDRPMEGRADIPPIPAYTREPSAAAAADVTSPSAGLSFGFAAAAHPPNTGLARILFMAPRTNSADGIASVRAREIELCWMMMMWHDC